MNHLSYIMRCAAVWAIGAYCQNAEATYPSGDVIRSHWNSAKVFRESFAHAFKWTSNPLLLSNKLPGWYEKEKGKLFEIEIGSHNDKWNTVADLENLKCDARLKKICKTLGSLKFLQRILTDETVCTLLENCNNPDGSTSVSFEPYFPEAFFNKSDREALRMEIKQSRKCMAEFSAEFYLIFEKNNNDVILTGYEAHYQIGKNQIHAIYPDEQIDKNYVGVIWRSKPQLPMLPEDIFKRVGSKIPNVYNYLRENPDMCKVLQKALFKGAAKVGSKDRADKLYKIFTSEAFWEGVFGEEIWEHCINIGAGYHENCDGILQIKCNLFQSDENIISCGSKIEVQLRIRISFEYSIDDTPLTINDIAVDFEKVKNMDFLYIPLHLTIKNDEITDIKFYKESRIGKERSGFR